MYQFLKDVFYLSTNFISISQTIRTFDQNYSTFDCRTKMPLFFEYAQIGNKFDEEQVIRLKIMARDGGLKRKLE